MHSPIFAIKYRKNGTVDCSLTAPFDGYTYSEPFLRISSLHLILAFHAGTTFTSFQRVVRTEVQWNSDITLPGYNVFPPITLFSLGPLGKAHKSNVCFFPDIALPCFNAFPLLKLLSRVPIDKNSGYNALPAQHVGEPTLFFLRSNIARVSPSCKH